MTVENLLLASFLFNWRTQTVVWGVLIGAVIGVILGALLAPRLSVSEQVGRFNVGVAIFGACVGTAGMITSIIVTV